MVVDSESYVLNTLIGEAFVLVNKKLLKHFKGNGSVVVFLSELLSMYKYHLNAQSLETDNSFPVPVSRFQHGIGMSAYKQEVAIKALVKENFVYVFTKGFPAKRYIIILFDAIVQVLISNDIKIKKQSAEFYATLNNVFNRLPHTRCESNCFYNKNEVQTIIEPVCGNISYMLRGTLIIISRHYHQSTLTLIEWTPKLIGQVRTWLSRRSIGKPFDFTIITRAVNRLAIPRDLSFDNYVTQFINSAKDIQDLHPDDQVYESL